MNAKTDFNDLAHDVGLEGIARFISDAAPPEVNEPWCDEENASAENSKDSNWPEPQPLVAHTESTPYPLTALPGGIGAAMREVVDFVRCPVALAACSALSALSLVGQALVDVRRAEKLVGPCSLYLLAIADSGERKTTCDTFFTAPIREWEAQQMEAAQPVLAKHRAAVHAFNARREGILNGIKVASKAGKPTDKLVAELERVESEQPESPKVPRLIYADTTPEALAWAMHTGWHSGGVLSSEAGIVLGSHGMNRDSIMRNLGLLNAQWEGGEHIVDRRTSESFKLRGSRLTLGLAAQPAAVRAFVDASKDLARGTGFIARFLIAFPESTQGKRFYKEAPNTWPYLSGFHRRLCALLDLLPKMNERGELSPRVLDLSMQAKAVWVDFHDEVEQQLGLGGKAAEIRDVASKAADNAVRLAALLHIYENGLSGPISAEHMSAGACIAEWHLYESRRFLGELALPIALSDAMTLDRWLLHHCRTHQVTSVSRRDVQNRGPNSLREGKRLDAAITELIEANRVRLFQEQKQKRIAVNPALLR